MPPTPEGPKEPKEHKGPKRSKNQTNEKNAKRQIMKNMHFSPEALENTVRFEFSTSFLHILACVKIDFDISSEKCRISDIKTLTTH